MADRLTDEQLQRIAVGALVFPDVPRAMAAELLAARARITELEAEKAGLNRDLDEQIEVRNRQVQRRRTAERTIHALWKSRRAWQTSTDHAGARMARRTLRKVLGEALTLRRRITELEAEAQADERAIEEARDERDAARDRAAELEAAPVAELIGYAVASTAGQDDYLCLASDLLHQSAATANGELIMARAESPSTPWRVVELREVTEP